MTYYTKKDLEREYKIADTTVYRTLKACGLSTARRKYTAEEITTRFKVARQLFAARHTVEEVAQYFCAHALNHTTTPTYIFMDEFLFIGKIMPGILDNLTFQHD
ncbi:hypothetical protein [Calothrix sp. NIES-2098]|uniref:hypothetical protein n=1 Tax=Calothrix sp. NIES-2098 TaxID=1954171 RepID=UPI000B5F68DC|nr:hypothetical protein NIES2098_12900 [Calothrix sp. NIES-2098]